MKWAFMGDGHHLRIKVEHINFKRVKKVSVKEIDEP
jgi:hypothetical protein